jgi:riboflavin synthase
VQAIVPIVSLEEKAGFRRISLAFPPELREGLRLGASVGLDGTCFSVVRIEDSSVSFEATAATLEISNLGDRMLGDSVNVERSAVLGQENSGHQMSGHIFGTDVITEIEAKAERNYMWFTVPEGARNTSFQRGFLGGLNGASLTVSEHDPITGAFKVNLIPDILRRTSFLNYSVSDRLNFEIDLQTMMIVDTFERILQTYRLTAR